MKKTHINRIFGSLFTLILAFSPLSVLAQGIETAPEQEPEQSIETMIDSNEDETSEEASESVDKPKEEVIESSDEETLSKEEIASDETSEEDSKTTIEETKEVLEENSEVILEEDVIDTEAPVYSDTKTEEPSEEGSDMISDFTNQVVKDLVTPLVSKKEEIDPKYGEHVTFFSNVELGTVYSHSNNTQVQVTFTKLPETPGSLTIEEVLLTDAQVEAFGATSNVAYDITSSMDNGTFEYDLKLPTAKDKTVSKVIYAESVEELSKEGVGTIENEKLAVTESDSSVTVSDLDHFTIFIVTSFEENQTTPVEVGYNGIWFVSGLGGPELERVVSGTNGIISSVGNYHGEMTGGAFTRWDGYKAEFPRGGYDTRLDVYLDMNLADGAVDKRFDFSSAINKPDNTHLRGFIFNVGTNPSSANKWFVSASNNSPGWPGNPAHNPVTLTETGWYTLEHQFRDVAGILEVTLNIYKKGGSTPVGTWVRSDPTDVIDVTVGGNQYGWFVKSDFDTLPIDQAEIEYIIPAGPVVTIESPTPTLNSYVRGTITGRAVATDDFGMGSYYLRYWKDAFEIAGGGTLVHGCQMAPGAELLGTDVDASCGYNTKTNPDGTYIFSAQFLDGDSNWGIAQREFIVDNTKPLISFDYPSLTTTIFSGNDVDIELSATDNFALKRITGNIYKDGLLFKSNSKIVSGTSGSYSIDMSTLPAGTYTMKYNASDMAGNIASTKTFTFTIDNTAPNTPLHESPVNNSFQNINDFYFDWSDVSDAVEYEFQSSQNPSIDSAGALEIGVWNNKNNGGLDRNHLTDSEIHSYGANGTWYWQVRAIDNAGNKSDWSSPWKITIDMVAPTIPVITSPTPEQEFATTPILNEWTTSTDANDVTYQVAYAYDDEHTFGGSTCSEVSEIDGKLVSGCRDTVSTSRNHTPGLSEQGGVTLWVRAMDEAGNVSDWSEGVHYIYEVPEVVVPDESDETDEIATTTDEIAPTVARRSSGGRSGSRAPTASDSSVGEVLGASTDDVCTTMYLTEYLREGADNSPIQVMLLQAFMNVHIGANLSISGFFGPSTKLAVMDFQDKYSEEVLKPWGVEATGIVYKTTKWKINNLICAGSEDFPIIP